EAVAGPGGVAHHLDEGAPFFIAGDSDGYPAVVAGALVGVVRCDTRLPGMVSWGHALTPPGAPVDRVVEYGRAGQHHAVLDLRDVDVLTLARAVTVIEGHHDGVRGVVAGGVVHVAVAPAGWRLAGQ